MLLRAEGNPSLCPKGSVLMDYAVVQVRVSQARPLPTLVDEVILPVRSGILETLNLRIQNSDPLNSNTSAVIC